MWRSPRRHATCCSRTDQRAQSMIREKFEAVPLGSCSIDKLKRDGSSSQYDRGLEFSDHQDLQVGIRFEVPCRIFGRATRRRCLEPTLTEADQAVAAAGFDGQLERSDRTCPVSAGLQHV